MEKVWGRQWENRFQSRLCDNSQNFTFSLTEAFAGMHPIEHRGKDPCLSTKKGVKLEHSWPGRGKEREFPPYPLFHVCPDGE